MAFGAAPTISASTPQPTTGTARFPQAKPGFRPGSTTIVAGNPATGNGNIILGGGVPQRVPAAPAGAAAAAAPPAPPAPTQSTPGPQGASLDAQALAANATGQFNANRTANNLTQQSAYATTDLQRALSSLGQQTPIQRQSALEAYNRQGLLYSGHLGQALGRIDQAAGDKQAALQAAYQRAQAARQAGIAAAQEGEQLGEQENAAASTARATAAAARDTTLGAPQSTVDQLAAAIAQQTAKAPATARVPGPVQTHVNAAGQKFTVHPAKGGAWHVYGGRPPVWVPSAKAPARGGLVTSGNQPVILGG